MKDLLNSNDFEKDLYNVIKKSQEHIQKKSEITIDDLKDTANYRNYPIELSKDIAQNLLNNIINIDSLIDDYNDIYGTDLGKNYIEKYYLDIDSLTIQIMIKYENEKEPICLCGIGFFEEEQMKNVYNFLK